MESSALVYEVCYTLDPPEGVQPGETVRTRPTALAAVIAAKVLARERSTNTAVRAVGYQPAGQLCVIVYPDGETDDQTWREPRAWQAVIVLPNGNHATEEVYGETIGQALHSAGVAIASGRWRLARLADIEATARRITLETQRNDHTMAAIALARAMGARRAREGLLAMLRQQGSRCYATEEEIELRKHYVSEMFEQLADNHTPAEIEQIRRAF